MENFVSRSLSPGHCAEKHTQKHPNKNNKDKQSDLLIKSESKSSNSKHDYDILEQIKKLSQLKDEGVLTLKEFENKK